MNICAFSFLLLTNLLKKIYCITICFCHQIIPFCFGSYKVDISMFSLVSPKTALFINLKNLAQNHVLFFYSIFISMYGFNQAFWLNLMILCSFLNTNPWFNACFKFLMCVIHFFIIKVG